MSDTPSPPLVLAITGASGAIYGLRLAGMLLQGEVPLHLLISGPARTVIRQETGREADQWLSELERLGRIDLHPVDDFTSPVASGSVNTRGMVIAPCSMGTLGRIAAGTSDTLIERVADVCLKERRRLLLLTRETPLSSIHLENMLTVSRAGGIVMPPVPAFYTHPQSIAELVDHTLYRVLDLLDIRHSDAPRWDSIRDNFSRTNS